VKKKFGPVEVDLKVVFDDESRPEKGYTFRISTHLLAAILSILFVLIILIICKIC